MTHIVSFSTGLSSALAVERVLKKYGEKQSYSEDVEIVFMDTLIEDNDNYRFMKDMETRWLQNYGKRITKLTEGRTPYQLAKDKHIIPNQRVAPCTFKLKIDIFTTWLKAKYGQLDKKTGKVIAGTHGTPDMVTIHIGYDFSEIDRCENTRKNYNAYSWAVDFPLLWRPLETRPYPGVCRQDWHIEPPRMYELGYSHANCGGTCVKQGNGDWIRTLLNFPDRYACIEQWEAEMRDHEKRKNYAILRDQSNYTVTPRTLKELRENYENGRAGQLDLFDTSSSCIHCGIGDLVDYEKEQDT